MVVIFGCNCDKDIDGMLEQLSLGPDKVIFTRSSNNPKAADPLELSNLYTSDTARWRRWPKLSPTRWKLRPG